jgi:haloalkane dehalogenase
MASDAISADFPFTKQRVPVLDSTMEYVDTGLPTPTSPTVVLLHGNPTSSYLYRNIIPHLSPIARCIAPDLVGFGGSGKMPSKSYHIRDHIRYFATFMDAVLPRSTTEKLFFVIHDWGSTLGFNWASKNEDRVAGLAFMEFILAGMKLDEFHADSREMFKNFRTEGIGRQLIIEQNLFIEVVLAQAGVARGLTEPEMQHYRAPFLDPRDREPIYRFPNELPFDGHPADVAELVEAYFAWLMETEVPKLMFWGEPGALVSAEKARELEGQMKNVRSVGIGPGMHYLQEDNPHLIGEETRKFVEKVLQRK